MRVKREVPRLSFWERFENVPTLELRPDEVFIFRTRAGFRPAEWLWGVVSGYLFCTDQRLVWRRHNRPPWIIEQPGDRLEIPRDDIGSVDAPSLAGDMGRSRWGWERVDIYTKRGPKYTFGLGKREAWAYVLDQWVQQT